MNSFRKWLESRSGNNDVDHLASLIGSLKQEGLSGPDYRIDIDEAVAVDNAVQVAGTIIADTRLDEHGMEELIKDNLQKDLFFFLSKKNNEALMNLGTGFEIVEDSVEIHEKIRNMGKFTAELILSPME
jgi:hypothetical protein